MACWAGNVTDVTALSPLLPVSASFMVPSCYSQLMCTIAELNHVVVDMFLVSSALWPCLLDPTR